MKTATVREVRQSFGKLLKWVDAGEEITVISRKKAVARILPVVPTEFSKPTWPDFGSRQRKMFGNKIRPSIVDTEREGYRW